MKNDEEEKMQTGFRTWIKKPVGVLSVLLIAMIIVSYFCGSQKYTLDKHIIILTVILVVLVLSESFSEIAVGSLLSLKRRTGELKEDLTAAREETSELRNQLSTIVSSVSNKNINYISQSMKDTLLQKNFDEEITEESSGSAQPDEMGEFPADQLVKLEVLRFRVIRNKIKIAVIVLLVVHLFETLESLPKNMLYRNSLRCSTCRPFPLFRASSFQETSIWMTQL